MRSSLVGLYTLAIIHLVLEYDSLIQHTHNPEIARRISHILIHRYVERSLIVTAYTVERILIEHRRGQVSCVTGCYSCTDLYGKSTSAFARYTRYTLESRIPNHSQNALMDTPPDSDTSSMCHAKGENKGAIRSSWRRCIRLIGIIVIKLQTSRRVITSSVLSLTGPDWVKVQLSHGHCAYSNNSGC